MAVFRRKYTAKDGKTKAIKKYSMDFRDHNDIVRRISAFTDRSASAELERQLKRLVALRMAGTVPDAELSKFLESCPLEIREKLCKWGIIASERAAAGKELAAHVEDWRIALEAKGNSAAYIATAAARVNRIASDCGWRTLSGITATEFDRWRIEAAQGGLSVQSVNHY